jgi:hypothetical protein
VIGEASLPRRAERNYKSLDMVDALRLKGLRRLLMISEVVLLFVCSTDGSISVHLKRNRHGTLVLNRVAPDPTASPDAALKEIVTGNR